MRTQPPRVVMLATALASVALLAAGLLALPVIQPPSDDYFCALVLRGVEEYQGIVYVAQDQTGDGPDRCDIAVDRWLDKPRPRPHQTLDQVNQAHAPIRDYWCVIHYPDWWTFERVEFVPPEAGCIPWDGPRWIADAVPRM